MADYNEKTVAELKEEAKARDLHGYSDKNKEELVALLEESDQGDGSSESDSAEQTRDEDGEPTLGHDSEGSDADNPNVVENLSPEGQEALDDLSEEEKEQADLALDASGPLHLQSPSERVQGGALNEEHAKELDEKFDNLPEGFEGGNFLEDGTAPSQEAGEPVQPEDVIDFPPPLEEVEEERKQLNEGHKETLRNRPTVDSEQARLAFPDEGKTVAKERLYDQRAQLYTDGLSGEAGNNLALSYRVQDIRPVGQEGELEQAREDENDPERNDEE